MENVHLAHIPRQTVRAEAGFRAEGGTFYLGRAVEVPKSFQAKVLPPLDEWQNSLQRVHARICR